MLKGAVGVNNLNRILQDAVNPQDLFLMRGERQYRIGDKVMQIRNNYDKDVFNGDMGTIIAVDGEARDLSVRYDDRNVPYAWEELDELVPAYAISIHKSQGGEYPVVVIPLLMQHFVLLQRNLVYTAVTRGRKLVVLVGDRKALAVAVRNNKIRHRYTWLAHRLAGEEGTMRIGHGFSRDRAGCQENKIGILWRIAFDTSGGQPSFALGLAFILIHLAAEGQHMERKHDYSSGEKSSGSNGMSSTP